MKITSTIARYLLGLIFLVFGLNAFFHFLPMPPPTGLAGQFLGAIFVSNFYIVIFLTQAVAGALLLIGRYVPLALVLVGPVIFNIFFFHVFMEPSGLPLAIVVVVLWFLTAAGVRSAFTPLFQQKSA